MALRPRNEWELMVSRMTMIAATEGEDAACAYTREWHAERKRRAAAASPNAPEDPDAPTSDDEPTRADRLAQYVEDWSEAEEEAFELGMQILRERDARQADSGDDAEDLSDL